MAGRASANPLDETTGAATGVKETMNDTFKAGLVRAAEIIRATDFPGDVKSKAEEDAASKMAEAIAKAVDGEIELVVPSKE